MNQIVFTVKTDIYLDGLKSIVETLNNDVYEEDGDKELTVEEVLATPELLKYICEGAVEEDGIHDPEEIWNMDGWADWKDHR